MAFTATHSTDNRRKNEGNNSRQSDCSSWDERSKQRMKAAPEYGPCTAHPFRSSHHLACSRIMLLYEQDIVLHLVIISVILNLVIFVCRIVVLCGRNASPVGKWLGKSSHLFYFGRCVICLTKDESSGRSSILTFTDVQVNFLECPFRVGG